MSALMKLCLSAVAVTCWAAPAVAIMPIQVIDTPLQGQWVNIKNLANRKTVCTQPAKQPALQARVQSLSISGDRIHYYDSADANQQWLLYLHADTTTFSLKQSKHIQGNGLLLQGQPGEQAAGRLQAFAYALNPDGSLSAPLLRTKTFYRCYPSWY